MYLAPISLFVYNRLEHTKLTVESLKKNYLANQSDLFIFSDAAKTENGKKSVELVRQYLSTIEGFKSVNIFEREENFGLAKSITEGVSQILNKYGKIIVLEDDLISSKYFLKFINDALNVYEDEDSVACISGYTYPVKNLPNTFFIKGADCLGWGTWKRAWGIYEPDGKKLLYEIESQGLTKEFDFDGAYEYTQMLKDQIAGKNNSWAVRWYASAFINNKYVLYPGNSFIFHNGSDGSGENTGVTNKYDTIIKDEQIIVEKIPIVENNDAKKKFKEFFYDRIGFVNYIKYLIRSVLKMIK